MPLLTSCLTILTMRTRSSMSKFWIVSREMLVTSPNLVTFLTYPLSTSSGITYGSVSVLHSEKLQNLHLPTQGPVMAPNWTPISPVLSHCLRTNLSASSIARSASGESSWNPRRKEHSSSVSLFLWDALVRSSTACGSSAMDCRAFR